MTLWRGAAALLRLCRCCLGGESVCGAAGVCTHALYPANGRGKPLTCPPARYPAHAIDQPYIVMMRAVILKIYLITVVMVNTIVVMVVPVALVKKLTGNTKTSR